MKKYLIFIVVYFFCKNVFSQNIIAGPIVGAVSDTSANLLFITDAFAEGFIKISVQPVLDVNGNINQAVNASNSLVINFKGNDTSNKVNLFKLDILLPDTRYYYLVSYGNSEKTGSFKTFPSLADTFSFSFTLGSCTEQHNNDSVFVEMQKHQPAFFLHLGDWLYTNNFNERKYYYTESLEHQQELYQKRYQMPNLNKLLQTTPIDFVFDDEDGVFDDFCKQSYSELKITGNKTEISEIPYPDSLRQILIQGLHTYFPAYEEFDDQAYHSFVCGNTEIFFLDTRSTRSPNTESFIKDDKYYKYKVPDHHNILDTAQLNWLLSKLKSSKAQWKFIITGVTFNKSYKKVLDIAMLKRVQHRTLQKEMTGIQIAASLSSMWFAFPETQAAVLNFCNDNQIKNVIVLSGDAHTAAIDDGSNAGFPELMAGGLAQKNSKLASIIKNNLKLNLWNQGGQGIANTNFNDAFGKVEINGNASVKLSCIDKYGKEICSYKVKDGFIPKKYNLKRHSKITFGHKLRAVKNAVKITVHNK